MAPFRTGSLHSDRRLAEIGSAPAVRAITARLARADLPPDERAHVLIAIGEARAQSMAALVEGHLTDSAYDAFSLEEARSAAAWAARRLGGKRMAKALRESALRRDGRDWATLVNLAILDDRAALGTLDTLRARRLRYPDSRFGREAAQLDAILADLQGGRSLARFDAPPDHTHHH